MADLEPAMTSDDWCTPRDVAALLGRWDLDPCSNALSHISAAYRCALDGSGDSSDGLALLWPAGCSVFGNPPYSDVLPWAEKFAAHRGPWCMLVKLDPTTKWWATLMRARASFAAFRKRLKFECAPGGAKRSGRSRQTSERLAETMTANFPSVLVYRDWEPSRPLGRLLWLPRASRRQSVPSARGVTGQQPSLFGGFQ